MRKWRSFVVLCPRIIPTTFLTCMDELGLFYRAIPQYSYLLESEGDKRQHGLGTKRMKAKDRLTVVLCANANDTVRL